MPKCHWHPQREASARCDLCGRPVCEDCATQVAEPPESYYLCPDCLTSVENLVERGLNRQIGDLSKARVWAGALIGGACALAIWLTVMRLISPTWFLPVRWMGYLSCGIISAILAVRFAGNRRGWEITWVALVVALGSILVGHYVSTNLAFRYYLAANPDMMRQSIDAGVLPSDQGWWLPMRIVLPMAWHWLTWMDITVMIAAVYLAYALTHRRRLWRIRWSA